MWHQHYDIASCTAVEVVQEGANCAGVEIIFGGLQNPAEVLSMCNVIVCRQWSERHSILCNNFGGYSLADAVLMIWIDQESTVRVGVSIDEAR